MYLVSAPSPFTAGCDGVPADGTHYINSEVGPSVAVNPHNTNNVVGVWEQDPWSTGGARGVLSGASFDGGKTWTRTPIPFSRCAGGNTPIGGNYQRASDPRVSFGPNNIAYAIATSFNETPQKGPSSSVLTSRSLDGGKTWSNPVALIADSSSTAVNGKAMIVADPTSNGYAYAVWDRTPSSGGGQVMFARTEDAGTSWTNPARVIYAPGVNSRTIGNELAVLPNDTLIDVFTQIDTASDGTSTSSIQILHSNIKGVPWSGPLKIADELSVGTTDPNTGAAVNGGSLLPHIAVAPTGNGGGYPVFVVWADARFTTGSFDAIALSSSNNGGQTWTAPVRINSDTSVPAFEPVVHVSPDSLLGVTYYDFRTITTNPAKLPTSLWLTHSSNAVTWSENQLAGPFNLDTAPNVGGLFLGDYQGLSSIVDVIEPLFVQTNSGILTNRTDVFSEPSVALSSVSAQLVRTMEMTAQATPTVEITDALRKRVSANIDRVMQRRDVQPRNQTP
jgi:hypothetical protein